MSSVQEIDVVLRPNGGVEIKVRGVNGPACLELTKKMEAYLGNQVVVREHSDEFHQAAVDELATETETHER